MQKEPTFHDRGWCFTFRFPSGFPGLCVKDEGEGEELGLQIPGCSSSWRLAHPGNWSIGIGEGGLSRRATRGCERTGAVGIHPEAGGGRREALPRPGRVWATDLDEVDHDCPFGGVARWPAFPEVSLSHSLVEPLSGMGGRAVSGRGGV